MVPVKIRSYHYEVLNQFHDQLFDLSNTDKGFSIEFMGIADCKFIEYPLFCLTTGNNQDTNLKDVLISAGIHGEEPAGVYTLMRFLKHDMFFDFAKDYRFLIFPCINPFGFEHGHRFNSNGVDINREFKKDSLCREANRVMGVLGRKARKFVCTIDLHETDPNWADEGFTKDYNPKTFYMWETASDKSIRIGDKVIKEIMKWAPVCGWPKIYGDTNNGGVVWYPEGCGNPVYAQGTTLDAFLNANYTPQSFTLETPCGWNMERRIATHLVALQTILELKRNT
jgi:hypothetical protein